MPHDLFSKYRKKRSFTCEIRHDPLVQAFDRRGKMLEVFNTAFANKLPHWQVQPGNVKILNDLNSPSKQIVLGHMNNIITYEDVDTLDEFNTDTKKFIEKLFEVYPEGLGKIKRIGVRFICIFDLPNYKTFYDLLNKIKSIYLSPTLPISLKLNDCRIILAHESGNIQVGPVKKGEQWVEHSFSEHNKNVPTHGLGLDIDSFAGDINVCDKAQLLNAFTKTFDLTQASEKEIVESFISR